MTKEAKIQEAYGEYWSRYKHLICENGWLDNGSENEYLTIVQTKLLGEVDFKSDLVFRPKSIQGIENNNGWLFGAPEKDGSDYWIIVEDIEEPILVASVSNYDEFWAVHKGDAISFKQHHITHHKSVEIPKPPIY